MVTATSLCLQSNKVLARVAALFPDAFLHLGGDEVDLRCWEGDPVTKLALQAEGDLSPLAALARQVNHAVGVAVGELGKDVVLWQDAHDLLGPRLALDYPLLFLDSGGSGGGGDVGSGDEASGGSGDCNRSTNETQQQQQQQQQLLQHRRPMAVAAAAAAALRPT
jgi:hypothetical protein